jgi:hypothetical protein
MEADMNNSSSTLPPYGDLVRKLKIRDGVVCTVLLVGGALILLGSTFPHLFRTHTSLSIRDLALLWMIVSKAIASALGRRDRRNADTGLTERAKELILGSSHAFGTVRIDNSLRGLSRSFWERAGNDVVVSRRARDQFTPEELDYALMSAACRAETGTRWDLIGAAFAALVCLLAFTVLTPKDMRFLVVFVIVGAFSMVTTYTDKLHATRRLELDTAGDEAAVDITGNVDAAESALTKVAENAPASAKIDERLQRIRAARHRTIASPLPPAGWTPSSS